MKKTSFYLTVSLLAGATYLLQSCSPEDLTKNDTRDSQNRSGTVELSFELEAVTFQENLEPGENSDFHFLDELAAEPVASRQFVNIIVYNNGSTDYLIEERKPEKISLPPASEGVPPNDIPPIAITKISNGMASFYDANGDLI